MFEQVDQTRKIELGLGPYGTNQKIFNSKFGPPKKAKPYFYHSYAQSQKMISMELNTESQRNSSSSRKLDPSVV